MDTVAQEEQWHQKKTEYVVIVLELYRDRDALPPAV